MHETVDEVKAVIRTACNLGMLACDHAANLDRSPHEAVEVDGFEVVSPHGAVELIYCQGDHCEHSRDVITFVGTLTLT